MERCSAGSNQRAAARVRIRCSSRGHNVLMASPAMTKAAASSFQAGKGSPRINADAPMPNTGTSSAMGLMDAAGWRLSSQAHMP